MKHRFVILIVLPVILLSVTGCSVVSIEGGTGDPLGFTERARLRANASVQIAESNERARAKEAQAKVDEEAIRQQGETSRNTVGWMFIPVCMIIVFGGGGLWIFLVYKGKQTLEFQRYQYAMMLPPPPGNLDRLPLRQTIETSIEPSFSAADYQHFAWKRNGILVWINGQPMIEDQLTGRRKLLTSNDS